LTGSAPTLEAWDQHPAVAQAQALLEAIEALNASLRLEIER
jgi:hypothetical protein